MQTFAGLRNWSLQAKLFGWFCKASVITQTMRLRCDFLATDFIAIAAAAFAFMIADQSTMSRQSVGDRFRKLLGINPRSANGRRRCGGGFEIDRRLVGDSSATTWNWRRLVGDSSLIDRRSKHMHKVRVLSRTKSLLCRSSAWHQ